MPKRKRISKFTTYVIIMLILITALLVVSKEPETANAGVRQYDKTTNYKLMKSVVKKNYPTKKVKIVNGNGDEDKYWNVILSRKNKDYIVVEKVVSVGNGSKHGFYKTADGNEYIIGYNKKVTKGKRITSYIIWNPTSNECDDIAYVIDNNKVRR